MSSLVLLFVVIILCFVSLINKHIVTHANPFSIQWMQCTLNVLLLPLWYYVSRKVVPTEQFSSNTYFWAILAGLLSTIGFILFLFALKEKPVAVATCYLSTYPILTMIVVTIMNGEKISIPRVFGMLTILCGVFMIQLWDK